MIVTDPVLQRMFMLRDRSQPLWYAAQVPGKSVAEAIGFPASFPALMCSPLHNMRSCARVSSVHTAQYSLPALGAGVDPTATALAATGTVGCVQSLPHTQAFTVGAAS